MEQQSIEDETKEEQAVNGKDEPKSEGAACSNDEDVTESLYKLDLNEPPPTITLTEKRMLKKDWKTVKVSVQTIGVITFIGLFEAHTEVHDAFKAFKNKKASDLLDNKQLRHHALLVMNIVDTCITNLDDREKLKDKLTNLGQRHASFKTVRVEFMDLMGPQAIAAIKPHLEGVWDRDYENAWSKPLMGPQAIAAIKPHLEGVWDRDHENAWSNLFKLIAYHLKRGIASV